ncbi:hypothetical protein [Nocardioides sp.]|uniref:hypothetical protein n=1 Tax=Nocardioides sp. TaxID=35761 RepID=UPI002C844855|nr:hypothetical protein [Nocardioides sp.]HXH80422.1 hypothetical protein [Nocardioides sp.]
MSDYESRTIKDFRWWTIEDLATTTDTVYPPHLGDLLSILLDNGVPAIPIDITE